MINKIYIIKNNCKRNIINYTMAVILIHIWFVISGFSHTMKLLLQFLFGFVTHFCIVLINVLIEH